MQNPSADCRRVFKLGIRSEELGVSGHFVQIIILTKIKIN